MSKKETIVVETYGRGANIVAPDGSSRVVYNVSDMMSEMLYLSGEYPGALMNDKRGWRFRGEA